MYKLITLVILLMSFATVLMAAENPFESSRTKIDYYRSELDKMAGDKESRKYSKLLKQLTDEEEKLEKAVQRKLEPYQEKIVELKQELAEAQAAMEMINAWAYGAPVMKDEKGDVTFLSTLDETEQRYVEILPDDFDPKKATDILITLHGHGSDRWQYIQQVRDECKAARDFAKVNKMVLISPDYRASTSWMGPAAEADLQQIIGILKRDYQVKRVFIAGASMGGTSCLIFTALHPDLIDGVMSSNGTANMLTYTNFQSAIAASYGGDKNTAAEEYKKRSPELFASAFTMPVAFTLGGTDTSVPPDSVRILVEHFKKLNKKDYLLLDRPQTGHSTNYADSMEAYNFMLEQANAQK